MPQDAETVALTFFNRRICQYGVPESIHINQGPDLDSRLHRNMKNSRNQKEVHDAWASTGQRTGRKNDSQPDRTTKGFYQGGTAWESGLKPKHALHDYRATIRASTGVVSFKMLTGRELRVPSDVFLPNKEVATDNASEYVLGLKEGIIRVLNFVR